MSKKQGAGAREAWLQRFAAALAKLSDQESFHKPIVGDLDDLMCTAEQIAGLLRDFAEAGRAAERAQLLRILANLKIVLESDLPMILEDVLPAIKPLLRQRLSKRDREIYEALRREEEKRIEELSRRA